MTHIEKVKSFLQTAAYHEKNGSGLDLKKGNYPFLTISREAGAGGNSLADAVLEAMKEKKAECFQDWQRFNQELCRMISEEPGLKVSLEPLLKFEYRSQIEDMMEEIIVGTTPQDVVNKKVLHLMRTLAAFGKVILVGRGGVCITRHLPLGVHVRLVAPLEARIRKMSNLLELTYEKAKEFVFEQDKSRARFLKTYFGRDIADPLLYDAVWNTGTVPLDQIAQSVLMMLEKKLAFLKRREGISKSI